MLVCAAASGVIAQEDEESIDGDSYQSEYSGGKYVQSPFSLRDDPERPRNYLLPPLVSWLLPGFDQWYEGQYSYAAAYSGVAAAALVYSDVSAAAYKDQARENAERAARGEPEQDPLDIEDLRFRRVLLGSLLYNGVGSLSTYHSFRSAVRSRRSNGEFAFLRSEETPADLLRAPFELQHLTKTTTLVPLGIAAGLHAIVVYNEIEGIKRGSLTGADMLFASAFSYNAGVHEEALFRGYVMPVMMQWTGSPFWSNSATALIFAAAHMNTIDLPLPQFALGWYLGYLTQQRGWTLSEAIFIHAWWDVFAFLTEFQITRLDNHIDLPRPTLWLPPLEMHF